MAMDNYERPRATIIGESLGRLLEAGTVSQRKNLKDVICASLEESYVNTFWSDYIVEIEIPGGPGKSPSRKGVEDPRWPEDAIEEEYEKTGVVVKPQINERKMEILNEGLRWNCGWAQEELVRMGGKLPKD